MRQNDSLIYIEPYNVVSITLSSPNGGFYEVRVVIGRFYYRTYVFNPYIDRSLNITYDDQNSRYIISYKTEGNVRQEFNCIRDCLNTPMCDPSSCPDELSIAILTMIPFPNYGLLYPIPFGGL